MSELKQGEYQLTFDIQPLANKLGIPKEKLAEIMADQLMDLLFSKEKACEQFLFLRPYW